MLADGVYIGGGVLLVIILILALYIIFVRR